MRDHLSKRIFLALLRGPDCRQIPADGSRPLQLFSAQIKPLESLVGTFRISQPGSSVATSLCEGEAVPKQVGVLEVRQQMYRMNSIRLSQVGVRVRGAGQSLMCTIAGMDIDFILSARRRFGLREASLLLCPRTAASVESYHLRQRKAFVTEPVI